MADERNFGINAPEQPNQPGDDWLSQDKWKESRELDKLYTVTPPAPADQETGNPAVELVKGVGEGIAYEVPQMMAQSAQFLGIAPETMKGVSEWAKGKLGTEEPGAFRQAGRMIPASIIPQLVTTALFPQGKALQLASMFAAPALFGLSQAQSTTDTAAENNVDPGIVPYITGGIEFAGETLANMALGRLLGPVAKMLSAEKIAAKNIPELLKGSLGQYVTTLATETLPTEILTEIGQNTFEALAEQRSGIRPNADPIAEGLSAIAPTGIMTLVMAPFALHAHNKAAGKISTVLSTPADMQTQSPEEFATWVQARQNIANQIEQMIPEDQTGTRERWREYASAMIQGNQPISMNVPLNRMGLEIETMRKSPYFQQENDTAGETPIQGMPNDWRPPPVPPAAPPPPGSPPPPPAGAGQEINESLGAVPPTMGEPTPVEDYSKETNGHIQFLASSGDPLAIQEARKRGFSVSYEEQSGMWNVTIPKETKEQLIQRVRENNPGIGVSAEATPMFPPKEKVPKPPEIVAEGFGIEEATPQGEANLPPLKEKPKGPYVEYTEENGVKGFKWNTGEEKPDTGFVPLEPFLKRAGGDVEKARNDAESWAVSKMNDVIEAKKPREEVKPDETKTVLGTKGAEKAPAELPPKKLKSLREVAKEQAGAPKKELRPFQKTFDEYKASFPNFDENNPDHVKQARAVYEAELRDVYQKNPIKIPQKVYKAEKELFDKLRTESKQKKAEGKEPRKYQQNFPDEGSEIRQILDHIYMSGLKTFKNADGKFTVGKETAFEDHKDMVARLGKLGIPFSKISQKGGVSLDEIAEAINGQFGTEYHEDDILEIIRTAKPGQKSKLEKQLEDWQIKKEEQKAVSKQEDEEERLAIQEVEDAKAELFDGFNPEEFEEADRRAQEIAAAEIKETEGATDEEIAVITKGENENEKARQPEEKLPEKRQDKLRTGGAANRGGGNERVTKSGTDVSAGVRKPSGEKEGKTEEKPQNRQSTGTGVNKPVRKPKIFTDEEADEAAKKLKELLGGIHDVSVVFNPEVYQQVLKIAGNRIEKGFIKFADFVESIVSEFGESIKPYLKSAYLQMKYHPSFTKEEMDEDGAVNAYDLPTFKVSAEEKMAKKSKVVIARENVTDKESQEEIDKYLSKDIQKHLAEHQIQAAVKSIKAVDSIGGFLNASGTGAGKTRAILAAAKHYLDKGHPVIILAPNEALGKPFLSKKNPQVSGSYANDAKDMGIPFTLIKDKIDTSVFDKGAAGKIFISNFNNLKPFTNLRNLSNTIFIIDEAHTAKNLIAGTATARAVVRMINRSKGVIFATATPIDKPAHLAYLQKIGIYEGKSEEQALRDLGMTFREQKTKYGTIVRIPEVNPRVGVEEVYRRIDALFNRMTERGAMIKQELSMQGFDIRFIQIPISEEARDIQQRIDEFFSEGLGVLGMRGLSKAIAMMHMRRQLEPFKVEKVVEMTKKELANGRQVIIFVSRVNESEVRKKIWYRNPMGEREFRYEYPLDANGNRIKSPGTTDIFRKQLIKAGVSADNIAELHGNAEENAKESMDKFQSGKANVMIATVESGGTGINLDDVKGNAPRTMFMVTAPWTSVHSVQALGRIWRMMTKNNIENPNRVFWITAEDSLIDHWNTGVVAEKLRLLHASVGGEIRRLDLNRNDAEFDDEGVAEDTDKKSKQYEAGRKYAADKVNTFWIPNDLRGRPNANELAVIRKADEKLADETLTQDKMDFWNGVKDAMQERLPAQLNMDAVDKSAMETPLDVEKTLLLQTLAKDIANNNVPEMIANETIQNSLDALDAVSGSKNIAIDIGNEYHYLSDLADEEAIKKVEEQGYKIQKTFFDYINGEVVKTNKKPKGKSVAEKYSVSNEEGDSTTNYYDTPGEAAKEFLGGEYVSETYVTIKDNGIGMSEDQVVNKFMKLGSLGKSGTTSRGAYGLAKAGFLLSPRRTELVTVKDGIKTTLRGTREQFFGIEGAGLPLRKVEKTDESNGTRMKMNFFRYNSDAAEHNTLAASPDNFSQNYKRYIKSGINVPNILMTLSEFGGGALRRKEEHITRDFDDEISVIPPEKFMLNGNKVAIHFLPPQFYRQDGDHWKIERTIYNKGLALFSIPDWQITLKNSINKPMFRVAINFPETVDVRDINYPFIKNRTDLHREIAVKIQQIVNDKINDINNKSREVMKDEFKEMIDNSPVVNGIPILIPFTDKADFAKAEKIISDNSEIVKSIAEIFNGFQKMISETAEGKTLKLAITVDPKVLGFRSNPDVTGHEFYAINPFSITDSLVANDTFQKMIGTENFDRIGYMAGTFVHTLVHEYAHNKEQNHWEGFTIYLGHLYGMFPLEKEGGMDLTRLFRMSRRMYEQFEGDFKSIQDDLQQMESARSRFRENNSSIYSPGGNENRGAIKQVSSKPSRGGERKEQLNLIHQRGGKEMKPVDAAVIGMISRQPRDEQSIRDVVEEFEEKTGTDYKYSVFNDLLEKYGVKIVFDPKQLTNPDAVGAFDIRKNLIIVGDLKQFMSSPHSLFTEMLAHESAHALSYNALKNLDTEEARLFAEKVKGFIDSLRPHAKYAPLEIRQKLLKIMETPAELISYGFTNKEFASWLNSINVRGEKANTSNSIWAQFKNIIKEFIGSVTPISRNKLDELTDLMDEYMDINMSTPDLAGEMYAAAPSIIRNQIGKTDTPLSILDTAKEAVLITEETIADLVDDKDMKEELKQARNDLRALNRFIDRFEPLTNKRFEKNIARKLQEKYKEAVEAEIPGLTEAETFVLTPKEPKTPIAKGTTLQGKALSKMPEQGSLFMQQGQNDFINFVKADYFNNPMSMPKEEKDKMMNAINAFGGIKNKHLRYLFSLPWQNAQKSPDWKNMWDIMGRDRVDRRSNLIYGWLLDANNFLNRRKIFSSMGYDSKKAKDATNRIQRIVVLGDDNLRNEVEALKSQSIELGKQIRAMEKEPLMSDSEELTRLRALREKVFNQYKQLITDRAYSYETLSKGIKDYDGKLVKLNNVQEYKMYRDIRKAEDNIFVGMIRHLQNMLFMQYQKQKWYTLLQASTGAPIDEATARRLVGAGLQDAAIDYSEKISVDMNKIWDRINGVYDEMQDSEKKSVLNRYEEIADRVQEDLTRLRRYISKLTGIEDEDYLENATRELFSAYQYTRPQLKKIRKLRNTWRRWIGFFPRKRQAGKYRITLNQVTQDPTTGAFIKDEKFMKMFDSKREGEKIYYEVVKKYGISGVLPDNLKLEYSPVVKSPEGVFEGVSDVNMQKVIDTALRNMSIKMEFFDKSGKPIDIKNELWNETYNAIAGQFQSRGAAAHAMHRKQALGEQAIKGYQEEDLDQVLVEHITSMAGLITKQEAAYRALGLMANLEDPTRFEELKAYMSGQLRNDTDLDRASSALRSFSFTWFLGAMIKSAGVNSTQPIIVGIPVLGNYMRDKGIGGIFRANRAQLKATKDISLNPQLIYRKPEEWDEMSGISKDDKEFIRKSIMDGSMQAQHISFIRGETSNMGRVWNQVFDVMATPFASVEKFNRVTSGLAMFRTALEYYKSKGMSHDKAVEKATEDAHVFINNVHYPIGKHNLPLPAQTGDITGVGIKTAYTFRTFTHNFLLNQLNFLRSAWRLHDPDVLMGRTPTDKEIRRLALNDFTTFVHTMTFVGMFGGLLGLPFIKDIMDWMELHFGYSPKQWARKTLRGIGGETFSRLGMTGLPSVLGGNISGSLAIGVPFLGQSNADTVFGVYSGLATKAQRAYEAFERGDPYRMATNISPEFIRGPLVAMEESEFGKKYLGTPGYATTTKGMPSYESSGKPLSMTGGEVAMKSMGFQPTRISEEREIEQSVKTQVSWAKEQKSLISEQFRIDRLRDPKNATKNMLKSVAELNKIIREREIPETPAKVSSIVQHAKQTKNLQQRRELARRGQLEA